jgi:DUF4097 and DUF4098 domain-containing protein YvlB
MEYKLHSLLIMFFVLAFSISALFSQETNIIKEISYPTEKGYTLTISTIAGTIDVKTWDKNEVEVKVTGNSTAEDMMNIDIFNTPTGIKIDGQKKSDFKKKSFSLNLKYDIKIPAYYNVDAYTGGGNISVTGLNGNIKANTAGGNIDAENINGNINGSTFGGNITILNNTGTIDVSTQGGNIKATGFNGKITVSTMGGNLILSGTGGFVNGHTGGGNVTLDYSGKNEGIELSTMAGNIHLDLPSDIDADADISTLVGKIDTDFASADTGHLSSFLKTKINAGGSKLKCTTSAGNITINKK